MKDDRDDKPNKAEEFLYKLSLRRDFQHDLQVYRLAIDMPQDGFVGEKERQNWFKRNKDFDGMRAVFAIHELRKKYKIPLAYMFALDSYLFFGDARGMEWMNKWSNVLILPPKHTLNQSDADMEELYRDNGEPYAKLLILGNGTKSEALDFINNNWEKVEGILKKQGWVKKKRVGRTHYKQRNALIKELWGLPTEKLQKEAASESTDKELLIQHILKKRKFGHVNEGYIRKFSTSS